MNIRVKLFGLLVDAAGKTDLQMENIYDTNSLKEKIISDFPALKNQPFVIAINKNISKENILLQGEEEIALLPPFAGG